MNRLSTSPWTPLSCQQLLSRSRNNLQLTKSEIGVHHLYHDEMLRIPLDASIGKLEQSVKGIGDWHDDQDISGHLSRKNHPSTLAIA